MNRGEGDFRITRDDFLRAVAVMGIEIPNRDAIRSGFQRIERSDRNVVEITKAHCPVARGVMSRRSHQTERALPAERGASRFDRCSSRFSGVLADIWMRGRIKIEIVLRLCNPFDVL